MHSSRLTQMMALMLSEHQPGVITTGWASVRECPPSDRLSDVDGRASLRGLRRSRRNWGGIDELAGEALDQLA
jgi:hypothetical protein